MIWIDFPCLKRLPRSKHPVTTMLDRALPVPAVAVPVQDAPATFATTATTATTVTPTAATITPSGSQQ